MSILDNEQDIEAKVNDEFIKVYGPQIYQEYVEPIVNQKINRILQQMINHLQEENSILQRKLNNNLNSISIFEAILNKVTYVI